jgi:nicotinamide riboside kinase
MFDPVHPELMCRMAQDSDFIHAVVVIGPGLGTSAAAKTWLFCDTTPSMTALYSRYYFQHMDPELARLDLHHTYDFSIVTAPDFPWIADGLQRESPAVRQHIHEQLLAMLEEREIPFLLVEGSLSQRLQQVQFTLDFLS